MSKTEAKLLWDDKYLYVGFRAYDKDIWGYFKKRDDPTCLEDVDEYWQLEIAIPFSSLPTLKRGIPRDGDEWFFHLARYDYSVYLPNGVELSSTAYLKEVDFHRYEDWDILKFKK